MEYCQLEELSKFPGGAVVKNLPANAGDSSLEFCPWVRKISWRRKWQPFPVSLPGKSRGQRNLVGYSPWDLKESDTTEQMSTPPDKPALFGYQRIG